MNKIALALISCVFLSQESFAGSEDKILDEPQKNYTKKTLPPPESYSEGENYIVGMGYFKAHEYHLALSYLKEAASYENNEAEYVIGRIYEFVGRYRDYKEAAFWYDLAKMHGNERASEAKNRIANKEEKYYFVPNFLINHFDYYSCE